MHSLSPSFYFMSVIHIFYYRYHQDNTANNMTNICPHILMAVARFYFRFSFFHFIAANAAAAVAIATVCERFFAAAVASCIFFFLQFFGCHSFERNKFCCVFDHISTFKWIPFKYASKIEYKNMRGGIVLKQKLYLPLVAENCKKRWTTKTNIKYMWRQKNTSEKSMKEWELESIREGEGKRFIEGSTERETSCERFDVVKIYCNPFMNALAFSYINFPVSRNIVRDLCRILSTFFGMSIIYVFFFFFSLHFSVSFFHSTPSNSTFNV